MELKSQADSCMNRPGIPISAFGPIKLDTDWIQGNLYSKGFVKIDASGDILVMSEQLEKRIKALEQPCIQHSQLEEHLKRLEERTLQLEECVKSLVQQNLQLEDSNKRLWSNVRAALKR